MNGERGKRRRREKEKWLSKYDKLKGSQTLPSSLSKAMANPKNHMPNGIILTNWRMNIEHEAWDSVCVNFQLFSFQNWFYFFSFGNVPIILSFFHVTVNKTRISYGMCSLFHFTYCIMMIVVLSEMKKKVKQH